ncbi:MAG: hypothetical protein ACRD7E_00035 [Bryobacteraceae bacterium]
MTETETSRGVFSGQGEAEYKSPLVIESESDCSLQLNWVRWTASGVLESDFGTMIALPVRVGIKCELDDSWPMHGIRVSAQAPGWVNGTTDPLVSALLARMPKGSSPDSVLRLAEAVYGKLAEAVELKLPSELARQIDSNDAGGSVARQLAAGVSIELHLPPLDRKEWPASAELLAECAAGLSESGQIMVRRPDSKRQTAGECALILAGAAAAEGLETSFGPHLAYRKRQVCSPIHMQNLLARYGLAEVWQQWADECGYEIAQADFELSLSLPVAALQTWFRAPGERSPDYVDVYAQVCRGVQKAMRAWLSYAWFADLSSYNDLPRSLALMSYSCSPAQVGKNKMDLTRDVLSPEIIRDLVDSGIRRVVRDLERVRKLLVSVGENQLAARYRMERRDVLGRISQSQKVLYAVLGAETVIQNCFLSCANEANLEESRPNKRALPKKVFEVARIFNRGVPWKVPKLEMDDSFLDFGDLLLMEATSSLREALGLKADLEVTLRVRMENGTERAFHGDGTRT